MSATAWIGSVDGDGEVRDGASVSVGDRGFLLGEGLFETMRAVREDRVVRVPLLPWHVERLAAGAARFGWAAPSCSVIERAIASLFAANGSADEVVRLTLSAGADRPVVVVTTRARVPSVRPIRLAVVTARRDPGDPTAELKTTSRAFWALAQAEAAAAGADEALVRSTAGTLAETTTGNLFVCVDGRLCTPARDGTFLPGVARRVLLATLGSAIEERPIQAAELDRATGLWVTNAVHGARPAVLVTGGPASPAEDPLAEAFQRSLQCGPPKRR